MTLIADVRSTPLISATRTSRTLKALPIASFGLDLMLITASCVFAALSRGQATGVDAPATTQLSLAFAVTVVIGVWLTSMTFVGCYQRDVFGAGADEFQRVARGSAFTAATIGIVCYLLKYDLPRGFFVITFAVGIPAVLAGRLAVRTALRRSRSRGALQERVLLSGTAQHVDEIAAVLRRDSYLGYTVVGALTEDGNDLTPGGIPVVGHVDDVHHAVREHRAEVLFMADSSFGTSGRLREIVYELESDDVRVLVAPSVADISGQRVKMRPTGGLPLIHIEKPRNVEATRWAKRAFDIVGASALLLMVAPLFALAAFRVWSHDRGPIFFSHHRIGKDGVSFGCLKFRTMVPNAAALHAELMAETDAAALFFKLKDDPRITRPGKWLRRYSFDELPQLLNVLRGDMSLVGPRPQVADEVALYQGHMQRRLLVRPGMTGLWQVSGRSNLTVDEAMRLDVYYVDNWSMIQDLAILMRTWTAVFGSRGAY